MAFYNTENWPEKSNYYRWPWSNNDNPVGWLEITDICNIHCRGCYRKYLEGHRDLEVLKSEVDIYNLLKDNFGDKYEPSSYLGGTGHIKDYKWWGEAGVMEKNGTVYGSAGPRTMEFLQMAYHWFKGRYFMYLKGNKVPRILLLLTFLLGNKRMRKVRQKLFWTLFNPIKWFQPVYSQSIGINQPPDMMENGMANMYESCPDACVFEDNLVSSCRLDEYRKYGRLMNAIIVNEESDKRIEKPVKVETK